MFNDQLMTLAKTFLGRCEEVGVMCVLAESCTGGLLAGLLTEIPGASSWVERGYVTYSNHAKVDNLGVDEVMIASQGAVSEDTAIAMAEGALSHSRARLSIAITGIAGPDGGTEDKPVGLVYVASAMEGKGTRCEEHHFEGSRSDIRAAAMEAALNLALKQLY